MTGAWKLAVRNLSRNRRRNLVTGLALAVGSAGLVVLGGYAVRVERLLRASAVYQQHSGHVAVWARGGLERAEANPAAYALPADAAARIEGALRADLRVERTGRYLLGNGLSGNGCRSYPMRLVGLDLDAERWILAQPEVAGALGSLVRPRAGRGLVGVPADADAILLGTRASQHLAKAPALADPDPGDAPAPLDCEAAGARERIRADPFVQLAVRTRDGAFGAVDAWVAGVVQGATLDADKTVVLASLATAQRLLETDQVSYVAAYLRDPRDAAAVAADAAAALAGAGLDVSVERFDDPRVNPFYVGTMGFLASIVVFIGTLVAALVALSVLNAMTLAVIERSRELGTLRALGFTRRQVLGVLVREAFLLASMGLAAGLALGLAVAAALNAAHLEFEPPGVGGRVPFLVTPDLAVSAAVAAVLLALAVVATFVAARRTLRERVSTLVAEVAA